MLRKRRFLMIILIILVSIIFWGISQKVYSRDNYLKNHNYSGTLGLTFNNHPYFYPDVVYHPFNYNVSNRIRRHKVHYKQYYEQAHRYGHWKHRHYDND